MNAQEKDVSRLPHAGQKSLVRVKLEEYLRGHDVPGTFVSDEDTTKLVGLDTSPQGKAYHALRGAQRSLLREGSHWHRVPGEGGIRLLADGESLDVVERRKRHIHKATGSTIRIVQTILRENLPDNQQELFRTSQVQLGQIYVFLDQRTAKKLRARNVQEALPVDKLLEAFNEQKPGQD